MGCAGSRPHLLPSLSNNHINTPQKGFILFDSKTVEYLKANETEIKAKLKERCDQKLSKKNIGGSKPFSLSNAKKSIFNNNNNGDSSSNGLKSNKSNVSLAAGSTDAVLLTETVASLKENFINSAVDYVLKYALNDFDIENFKSSNHLSLKQIRKEIIKKNSSNNKISLSKLNSSVSMNNTSTSVAEANASLTTSSTVQDFSLHTNKSIDPAFYKQALSTAIDEFGSFIQENFIVINEFQVKAETFIQNETIKEEEVVAVVVKEEENEQDEALKLKEALALARQNFYKGKVSTVCLTKTGGYVVKEVKEFQSQETEKLTVPAVEPTLEQIPSNTEQEQQQEKQSAENSEIVLETQTILVDDNLDKIKQLILKAFDCSLQEKLTINEFSMIKTHLVNLLNETIESIVNYTTKSSAVNESSSSDDFILDLNAAEHADLLILNLEKSKRLIENLNFFNESDLELVDEKLVEAILNLDYVNKEFKSYLKILEESQIKELETKKQSSTNKFEEYIVKAEVLLSKNIKIRLLADQIDELNAKLPKKLFTCKCLPHPNEVNQSVTVSEQMETNNEQMPEIDIKKELAISILNVGEILAKTIDHCCNEETTTTPVVTESNEIHVDIIVSSQQDEQEKVEQKVNKQESATEASGSSISSMSSPSVSTSSMSPSGSISPVQKQTEQQVSGEDLIETKSPQRSNINLVEENMELIEKFKCVAQDKMDHLSEISYLVNEISADNQRSMKYIVETDSSSDINQQQNQSHSVTFRSEKSLETNTSKRMSLDEELFYHLEEVDKKVKYMNETCSENEDDDDDENDDEDYDFDPELENVDDERLFHPRTPAKIKNDIKSNRNADLQNEIKQISNVIQGKIIILL
jgi:hypothetical protein